MARQRGEDLHNPDFAGEYGRAWEVLVDPDKFERVEQSASLGTWLIEAPYAHPAWNYHGVALMHLRDIPGAGPAVIIRPGATHELWVHALDPTYENHVDPTDITTLHTLEPPDTVEQLILPSDERAIEVARLAVQKCVTGELVPDSDFRADWQQFLRAQEQA